MIPHEEPNNATSSTATGTRALPYLPAELVLLIIENVPADHILPFRTLCRSIRTHIDTTVFTSYLHHMKLIGHVSTFNSALVTFNYSHIFEPPNTKSSPPSHAVFRVDSQWLGIYED